MDREVLSNIMHAVESLDVSLQYTIECMQCRPDSVKASISMLLISVAEMKTKGAVDLQEIGTYETHYGRIMDAWSEFYGAYNSIDSKTYTFEKRLELSERLHKVRAINYTIFYLVQRVLDLNGGRL